MGLELVGHIGELCEILAVGKALGKQCVHDAAGQRTVGARPRHQMDMGFLGGAGAVRIHHHQFRAPLALGSGNVLHDVDLCADRVCAPNDNQIAVGHLTRIQAALGSGAGDPAGVHERNTEGGVLARVTHDVAKALDAVALHEPHGAGVVEGPHSLAAVALRGTRKPLGHLIQSVVPGKRLESRDARTLGTGAAQGLAQPIRVVDSLGIARHLGADHTRRIVVVPGPVYPTDGVRIDTLHLQRAGARAIVGAGRVEAGDVPGSRHYGISA